MEDWGQFYATQSPVTDPGEYRRLYDCLPDDVPSLCKIIQGLLIHLYWAHAYGVTLSEKRKNEVRIRKITRQIARILELDDLPLTTCRVPAKRIVGTCRDHSALLISFLRHRRIPARLRAGFATYLKPRTCEEHYLCQYWSDVQDRWITVDAQLDPVQCRALNIQFDPCDVPEDRFVLAGQVWQNCRQGKADPGLFGILDNRGMWFIGGAEVHDVLALNKIEIHPWDIWPLMPSYQQKEFAPEYLNILDHMAGLSGNQSPEYTEIRQLYQTEKLLQPPPDWEP